MERKKVKSKPIWLVINSNLIFSFNEGVWHLSEDNVLQTPDDKIILFQDKNGIHEIAYSDDREIIVNGQSISLKKFKFTLNSIPSYEIPKSRIKVFLERLKWFFNFIA